MSKKLADDLKKLFLKEIDLLTYNHLFTMKIIFEYIKNENINVPASYIEKKYGSVYVYEILKKLQNLELVKQIKPSDSKNSFYTLTEKGLLIAHILLEETEKVYKEAETIFVNSIIELVKYGRLVYGDGKGAIAFANALAKACSKIHKVNKHYEKVLDYEDKVDSNKIAEEMREILRSIKRDKTFLKQFAELALSSLTSRESDELSSSEDRDALIENILKKSIIPEIEFVSACIDSKLDPKYHRLIFAFKYSIEKFIENVKRTIIIFLTGVTTGILVYSIIIILTLLFCLSYMSGALNLFLSTV